MKWAKNVSSIRKDYAKDNKESGSITIEGIMLDGNSESFNSGDFSHLSNIVCVFNCIGNKYSPRRKDGPSRASP